MRSLLQKGKIFDGPNGQGYVVTRDLEAYDRISISDLSPFGGAPDPKEDETLPDWLCEQIWGPVIRWPK